MSFPTTMILYRTRREQVRLDWNVAPYSRPTTNVIASSAHSMNQERSKEEEKEKKRDRKDRGQEADGKKGSSTKQ